MAIAEPPKNRDFKGPAIPRDPIVFFQQLLADAHGLPRDVMPEPTAFALATVGAGARPSIRMLLLKHVDHHGFVFYTNLESRKGRELSANPHAALNFHWAPLERQVRIEGDAMPVSDPEADEYFATRARGSQIGAWASRQSSAIDRPGDLERRVAEFQKKFEGVDVPRPPFWSGFRLLPTSMEFWKGKPSRLHERQLFVREGSGWRMTVLYP